MDAFFSLIKAFIACYREGTARKNHLNGVIWLVAALRIFAIPGAALKLASLSINTKIQSRTHLGNPFYFLVHKYHLSKRFTLRQRLHAALSHHEYELKNYDSDYATQVYKSDGIPLWSYSCESGAFVIRLIATDDNYHEGELSVVFGNYPPRS